jgi:glycosyltransferase involved in cell wall biosynthesis
VNVTGPAAASQSLKGVQQRASHAALCRDMSRVPAPLGGSRAGCLDAIVVPASRPATHLEPAINLATRLGVLLVLLCSKQTRADEIAERASTSPGLRALVVEIPESWGHPDFPTETSSEAFRTANADRASDLSAKRNIGLLLARLQGWNKIAFLDDDITISRPGNIARLAAQLDRHQVAGMIVRKHPDNSVVCHARRDAGLQQDVFLTGAALGVHCNSLPLSLFPDIFNEDWLFFAPEAAGRQLPHVGYAKQPRYDPYARPERARCEEFGDLLAEGLYALIAEEDSNLPFGEQLRVATKEYWLRFIEARRQVLTETKTLLFRFLDKNGDSRRVSSAIASLKAAESQLTKITADLCVNFIDAWQEDLANWQKFSNPVNNVGSTLEAMDFLGLRTWTMVETQRASGLQTLG